MVNLIIKLFKKISQVIFILFFVWLFFFLVLVVPNDLRIKEKDASLLPRGDKKEIYFDFISALNLSDKNIPGSKQAIEKLKEYPYVNSNPDFHSSPEEIHLTLGRFPEKGDHRRCFFAPTQSEYVFSVDIPDNANLEFGYGIISSIKRVMQPPSDFIVILIDDRGKEYLLFQEKVLPLKPFPFDNQNQFYRNIYQYIDLADERDGKWQDANVNLEKFAGQKVKIAFRTKSDDNKLALAFWSNPRIFRRVTGNEQRATSYNLVFIIVDTLRSDFIGVNNQDIDFTPNFDRLAKKGINFSKAFSNGNMTQWSIPVILTSRYAPSLGGLIQYYMSPGDRSEFYKKNIPTLATVLSKNNYVTKAIGCTLLMTDGMGKAVDYGFDEVIIRERPGYNTIQTTYEAISWLKDNSDKKFSLFLYYDAPHGPYKPPLRFLKNSFRKEWFKKDFYQKIQYGGEVAFSDYYIGKVLNVLDKLDLTKKTLIVLLGDHGDTFKKYPEGFYYYDHGVSLSDDEIHVPLIISLPGLLPEDKKVINQTVQLMDCAPTVTDILGLKENTWRGKSLYPLVNGKEQKGDDIMFIMGPHNVGIRDNDRYKYIRNFSAYYKQKKSFLFPGKYRVYVKEELYDLKNDPGEYKNIAYSKPEVLMEMKRLMNDIYQEEKINQLMIYNVNKHIITGNVIVSGEIAKAEITGGNILKTDSHKTEFEIKNSNPAVLSWRTNPVKSGFKLELFVDGKKVNPKDILVSNLALPLLNESLSVSETDLSFLNGIGESSGQESNLQIFLGRIPLNPKNPLENQNLPEDVRKILEDWGYISQGKKQN